MELKFRAWDGKRFYYADMADLLDGYKASDFRVRSHEIEDYIIEPFTTIQDKNKTDVYMNDLMKDEYGISTYLVYWRGDRWGLQNIITEDDYDNGDYYRGDDIYWELFTIVGNIHEGEKIS